MPLRGPQLQGLIADIRASVIPLCWSIRVWPAPNGARGEQSRDHRFCFVVLDYYYQAGWGIFVQRPGAWAWPRKAVVKS